MNAADTSARTEITDGRPGRAHRTAAARRPAAKRGDADVCPAPGSIRSTAAPAVPVLPQETEILVVEADDARSEEVDDVYGGVEEVEHIKPKDDDTLSTHSSFAGGMAL